MSVWLSLTLALLGTVGFFVAAYGGIITLVEARRLKAKPRLGLMRGEKQGAIGVWLGWDPAVFSLQVYRVRIFHTSPDFKYREGQFTVTFDPPQKVSFGVSIDLPPEFRELIEVGAAAHNALITVEVRTSEEIGIWKTYTVRQIRRVYHGGLKGLPAGYVRVKATGADGPAVTSLDYSELVVRRKTLKELEAAARKKGISAKPAPAAGGETAAATSPGGT